MLKAVGFGGGSGACASVGFIVCVSVGTTVSAFGRKWSV